MPYSVVFRYQLNDPRAVLVIAEEEKECTSIQIGKEAWVKLPDVHCLSQWGKVCVCSLKILVDGIPCHFDEQKAVRSLDTETSNGKR